MGRDEFTKAVISSLAQRVGNRCSNPKCRQLTCGPTEDPRKALNVGEAAHISAAAEGGERYDPDLTREERRAPENGIWLCRRCAKLVDNDPARYTVELLLQWKGLAEQRALHELEVGSQNVVDVFHELENLMPELLAEMAEDLAEFPTRRVCILKKRSWTYWGEGHELVYHYDDHPDLDGKFAILENHGFAVNITSGNARKYQLGEELTRYLRSRSGTNIA